MKLLAVSDYQKLSLKAAEIIATQVRQKPNSILGLATGSTPLGCYKELVRLHKEEGLDFSAITTFNLDEYYGLKEDDINSYHYYMNHYFFDHININKASTHIPNSLPQDMISECQAYDQLARDMGGMDLQILGLGTTGHIAFNEPDSTFHPFTRLVNLDKSTMAANGHFFKTNEAVPHQAVTVGMRFILNSRLILLLVSSDKKAEALERTLNGPIDPMVPASILQLHPNVIIIADAEARSKL
ncbi:MAG TPA: glucosamine-6-phosphate deaminase [Methylotenera sp.]|nr:glucosamine-6-phosphate deaminase [Methylotenera sp.]